MILTQKIEFNAWRIIIYLFAFSLTFVGCEEEQTISSKPQNIPSCDSAILRVINRTSDTIRYCWGCNMYTNILPPGQNVQKTITGPINQNRVVWVPFQTSGGTTMYEVSKCYVEYEIE